MHIHSFINAWFCVKGFLQTSVEKSLDNIGKARIVFIIVIYYSDFSIITAPYTGNIQGGSEFRISIEIKELTKNQPRGENNENILYYLTGIIIRLSLGNNLLGCANKLTQF